MSINAQLWEIKEHIRERARAYGLDFFETIFEVVDYKKINELAAYGGFPTRYPHWRFGMEYEQLSKSAEYGLSKIYEMVINNDPSYAYLLEGNNLVDQKTVIAHVYAHVDFFKNNYYFSKTNRKMVDAMANHATRVRRYIDRKGIEAVEDFIDTCLSIDNLIDYYSPFIERRRASEHADEDREPELSRFQAKDYMESFINPEEVLAAQRKKLEEQAQKKRAFPLRPERDVMLFLLEHAPLERWEADVLGMIRDEAYYFAPQGQTKIMNEGWACVDPGTLVFTHDGLVPMGQLVQDVLGQDPHVQGAHAQGSLIRRSSRALAARARSSAWAVSDGQQPRQVYDAHVIEDHDTITLTTACGLRLCGSSNHRVMDASGAWQRLDALAVGQRVHVSGGAGLWAQRPAALRWQPRASLSDLAQLTSLGGPLGASTLALRAARAPALNSPRGSGELGSGELGHALRAPQALDEELAACLGYLVGAGRLHEDLHTVTLQAEALDLVERFAASAHAVFGLRASLQRLTSCHSAWLRSGALCDFLIQAAGLAPGPDIAPGGVPSCVLRSPWPMVRAFLRALFQVLAKPLPAGGLEVRCDGHALAAQLQLVLLNAGVLSRLTSDQGRAWRLALDAPNAQRLTSLLQPSPATDSPPERDASSPWQDEIVHMARGRGRVVDISVRQTHRYAAAGFINHNSFWHSRILTEGGVLDASEIIDFADINSRVLQTSPGQLNPYKLGVELFRDIEYRWDTGRFGREWEEVSTLDRLAAWNKDLGLGRQKLFEVRKLYNDITFIDEFLTEDFARRNKMFSYIFNKKTGNWEIESRDFHKIKQRLLDQLTNFGQPFIFVKDGNFKNRAELLLHHKFSGVELRVDYARGVLQAIQRIWKRPVNLETILDGKGVLLSFNGQDHAEKSAPYEPIP